MISIRYEFDCYNKVTFTTGWNKKDQHKMLVKIKRLEGIVFFLVEQPTI
ncbi:hypothetical protein M272_19805 [Vibrio natriegens NBRC 15636 = ATCC 14048 = DSM 759]|jgi:hypothetical protein|nr:hypothetical protein M272_19805 [Vibrio natriegens NBRC 15636 = ATCC 14048 = DSM 759]